MNEEIRCCLCPKNKKSIQTSKWRPDLRLMQLPGDCDDCKAALPGCQWQSVVTRLPYTREVIAGVKIAILYSGSEDAYRFFIAVSLNLFVRLRKMESGRNRARIGSK